MSKKKACYVLYQGKKLVAVYDSFVDLHRDLWKGVFPDIQWKEKLASDIHIQAPDELNKNLVNARVEFCQNLRVQTFIR